MPDAPAAPAAGASERAKDAELARETACWQRNNEAAADRAIYERARPAPRCLSDDAGPSDPMHVIDEGFSGREGALEARMNTDLSALKHRPGAQEGVRKRVLLDDAAHLPSDQGHQTNPIEVRAPAQRRTI